MNEDIKNMFLTEETNTIVKRFMRGDFADYELADAFCDIIERIDDKSVLVELVSKLMTVSGYAGYESALDDMKEESDDEYCYDED